MTDPAPGDAPTAARKRVRPCIELPDGRHADPAARTRRRTAAFAAYPPPDELADDPPRGRRASSMRGQSEGDRIAHPSKGSRRAGRVHDMAPSAHEKAPSYKMREAGTGPRIMRAGSKSLILIKTAGDRRRDREAEAAAAGKRGA